MKRNHIFLPIVCLVVIFLSSCSSKKEKLNYVSSIIQVELPQETQILDYYNNLETCVAMKLSIPQKFGQRLISEKQFNRRPWRISYNNRCFQGLNVVSQPRLDSISRNWFYQKPYDNGIGWSCMLNSSYDTLWVNIAYPDWGGD